MVHDMASATRSYHLQLPVHIVKSLKMSVNLVDSQAKVHFTHKS